MNRYREGVIDFLEVVTAQTRALQTERDALDLERQRLSASVNLIRALGGGWTRDSIDTAPPAQVAANGTTAAAVAR